MAHAGVGVTVFGIVCVSTFATEQVFDMKPGQVAQAGDYLLRFDGMQPVAGPNYHDQRGFFSIRTGGVQIAELWSAKRVYVAGNVPTTEAGIHTFGLSQLYISLGDPTSDGGIVVRIWWKPFILCIWGGGFIMALGGATSLSDRRLRVGAPRRNARAAAPSIQPGE
jgi:cytochrome c-type biogenesis protein CcmF